MTGQELLDYTRKHLLRDFNTPPLFPNDLLVRYLDEGQQRLVERTHAYIESDRTLEISANETTYALDDDVAFVYQVRLDGFYNNLVDVTESWLPTDTAVMRPNRFATDTATQTIRFYPAPDIDYTAILRVAKLPDAITLDNLDHELELKARYQIIIADWAAYRCWGNDDVDGRNDGAAVNALAKFKTVVTPDSTEYEYLARDISSDLMIQRVDVGKGLRENYFGLKVYNTEGADFTLASISFAPVASGRRI